MPVAVETGCVVAHARVDHLVQQRAVQVLGRRSVASEGGIEAALALRLHAIGGVHVGTRVVAEVRRIGVEPEATAIDAAKRVQLHIAVRAEAAVTGDAAAIENWLNRRRLLRSCTPLARR